jgi:hypothetical protein
MLSEDSHRVALEAQVAMSANNLNTALALSVCMSWINCIDCLLIWLKTNQFLAPVIIVTGYFSTQDKIFRFPRNAKTFTICLGVVFVILRVFVLVTILVRRFVKLKGKLACIMLGQWDELEKVEQEALVSRKWKQHNP